MEYSAAAREALDFVTERLGGELGTVHTVEARAKEPLSLLDKLRRKNYADPHIEVTDLVGVRVITYYPDATERAATLLRPALVVNEAESFDRLEELSPGEFGYRSIHLVGQLPSAQAALTKHLGEKQFEIQLRSLLQHSWAAVEHDVVYKSGVRFPDGLKRQFAALAGALETLDQAFMALRASERHLAEGYREKYEAGHDAGEPLDAARLVALLECERPDGQSLRRAEHIGASPGARIEKLVTDALVTAGIQTAQQMRTALARSEVKTSLKKHASAVGADPNQLSHLVVSLVVIWIESHDVLIKQFPELRFDATLATTLGFDVSAP